MLSRSTLLHLRIPFSFYLLPVFCFAVSLSPSLDFWRIVAVFFILHFLLYPASNGYNSYFDKDEDSIGGLEKPPPVDRQLVYVSLALDGFALLAGFLLGWEFVAALFLYGLVSKAYSDERIRLKRYPFISWILASFFQGAFTFLATYQAVNDVPLSALLQPAVYVPALLTTLLLGGSYPMTQVYQHKEDARRGDMTMSRLLGVYGTFWFTALIFLVSVAGFYVYFQMYHTVFHFWLFILCLSPGLVFFLWWFWQVYRDIDAANFQSTMRLNLLTAIGMNVFFVLLGWMIHTQ